MHLNKALKGRDDVYFSWYVEGIASYFGFCFLVKIRSALSSGRVLVPQFRSVTFSQYLWKQSAVLWLPLPSLILLKKKLNTETQCCGANVQVRQQSIKDTVVTRCVCHRCVRSSAVPFSVNYFVSCTWGVPFCCLVSERLYEHFPYREKGTVDVKSLELISINNWSTALDWVSLLPMRMSLFMP